jgi:hypothetical protein
MKKLIALVFALIFVGAGTLVAADLKMTGSYYARGSYFDNVGGTLTNAEETTNYDHELSVDTTWKIDDTTAVFARFEMRDETWGSNNPAEGTAGGGVVQLDDNIIVEQVYAWHKFTNGHTIRVGKMPSGAWATLFQDNGSEAYRVYYAAPTAIGTFIPILQKNNEVGAAGTPNSEEWDNDSYILAYITKIGDFTILPLFVFTDNGGAVLGGTKTESTTVNLGINGKFGDIGFESEFGVSDVDYDLATIKDSTTYGAYLNVWMTSGALKFGALGAYGSFDSNAGVGGTGVAHDFGDDFEAGGALLMGDDITFFGGNDLSAGRLLAVYADYALNEKLSIGGYFGWATCGVDNNGIWDGADVWEISADVTYKITPNVEYKVAAGYAQLEWGNNTVDPDEAVELYHKLSFNF